MNESDIKNLAGEGRKQELSVPEAQGLYLILQKTGAKSFQFRTKVSGRTVRRTLGRWPEMKLKDARLEAARLNLEVGDARAEPKKAIAIAQPKAAKTPKGITFRKAWALYMEAEGNNLVSAPERWRIFHNDLEPTLGDTPLSEIDRDSLEDLLAKKARKAPVASNGLHQKLNRFFNWSKKEGFRQTRLERSPMDNVAPQGCNGKPKSRFLNDEELSLFFQVIKNGEAGIFANGLLACLYTGQRRSAIFTAKRSQLADDILTIDMKDPKPDQPTPKTLVWFHPSVMDLLPDAGAELFAGRADDTNKVTTKLVGKMSELAGRDIAHWSPHDLRRSMSNWMGDQLEEDDSSLIDPFMIERCLSHMERGVRSKHYSVNQYLKPKKRAWKFWGDHLDTLKS